MDYNMDIYADYLSENYERLAEQVDARFEASKDYIRTAMIRQIRSYLTPLPTHYIWQYDGCPYDYSGILVASGLVNTEQSVSEFLELEYTGEREATYTSSYGFHYCTYGDELSQFTLQLGYGIMSATVREQLNQMFPGEVTDHVLDELLSCYGDDVYDNCLASDFFFYETAVEFAGIGEYQLNTLPKSSQKHPDRASGRRRF